MPTQQFDGESLEEILEQVNQRFGNAAQIVEAKKRRAGGLGGFFSHDRYEVKVDVDPAADSNNLGRDTAQTRVAQPRTTRATSLLELVDEVNAVEGPARAPVSTETESFADIFERIAAQADGPQGDCDNATGPTHATSGVAGAGLDFLRPNIRNAEFPTVFRDAIGPPVTSPTPQVSTIVKVGDKVGNKFGNKFGDPAVSSNLPTCDPTNEARVAEGIKTLRRRGLPLALVPTGNTIPQLYHALDDVLRRLPRVPAMTIDRGGIIAVIGDKAGAKQTASELAVLCKRRPDDIVIASPTKRVAGSLHDTTDVAIAMRTWSRRTKPTVVVIESAVGRDEDWAHEMLSALEPGITWAVVDAYRKPEDIAAWTASLGGVDALALQHLDETATPGSILGLGIPVGRIDGQRASAALWVAVLTEGVAA